LELVPFSLELRFPGGKTLQLNPILSLNVSFKATEVTVLKLLAFIVTWAVKLSPLRKAKEALFALWAFWKDPLLPSAQDSLNQFLLGSGCWKLVVPLCGFSALL